MINKNDGIRIRIEPRITDATYFLTKSNILTFMDLIDNSNFNNVLDVGCGEKPFLSFFSENTEYIGIDVSQESLADIVLDLNVEKIPYPDSYFDLIIMSEVMEHVFNIENLINEAIRVLKKDGILYITTPFALYEHGKPYDFYRFTESFYRRRFGKLFNILTVKRSNTIFSAPLIVFNNIFCNLPLPKKVKNIVIAFNNYLCIAIEYFMPKITSIILTYLIKHNKNKIDYIWNFPAGISTILKKL